MLISIQSRSDFVLKVRWGYRMVQIAEGVWWRLEMAARGDYSVERIGLWWCV
jgi:hypothetical protein